MEEKNIKPSLETEVIPTIIEPKQSKWFLIVIIIAFITLLISSAIFYFQNKSQSSNNVNTKTTVTPSTSPDQEMTWKTYTNTKYNFSIDYPSNWSFREYPDSKDGAAFNPIDKPEYPDASESISISAGNAMLNYQKQTLEEYAKTAGTEIQNYNKLATIKKVTTLNGAVGYETTWMVQGMTINGVPPNTKESESLPITYFEIPGNKTSLIRVSLDKEEDLAMYEKMLTTVKIIAPLSPLPTIDETAILKNIIKKYISLKHKSNEDALTITVSTIEGDYAKGGVSDEGGGGIWFASKEEGVWALVWDGNGIIECSTFSLYPNFPKSMIPQCYDAEKQDVVER